MTHSQPIPKNNPSDPSELFKLRRHSVNKSLAAIKRQKSRAQNQHVFQEISTLQKRFQENEQEALMLYYYHSSEAEQDTLHTSTTFCQDRSNLCEKELSSARTPLTNLDLNSSNVQNLRSTGDKEHSIADIATHDRSETISTKHQQTYGTSIQIRRNL
jgi:hypothetical protein